MKELKTIIFVLLAFIMVFGMSVISFGASKEPSIVKSVLWIENKQNTSDYKAEWDNNGDDEYWEYFDSKDYEKVKVVINNLPKKAKITGVKSANPKAIRVYYDSYAKKYYLKGLKAGNTKVTVSYTVGEKTYKISTKFTVKKYPNPVKSVTVNGKKYSPTKYGVVYGPKNKGKKWENKYQFTCAYNTFYTDITQDAMRTLTHKINLVPASGWKITKITAKKTTYDKNWNAVYKTISYKNNKAFKVTTGDGGREGTTEIVYYLKKGGDTLKYRFTIGWFGK